GRTSANGLDLDPESGAFEDRRRRGLRERFQIREREGEREGGALAHGALDRDLAAVRLDDRLDDVEAQPEPRLARGAGILDVPHLVEAVEDLLQVLGRDSGPAVLHRDEQEAGPRLGGEDDLAAVAQVP